MYIEYRYRYKKLVNTNTNPCTKGENFPPLNFDISTRKSLESAIKTSIIYAVTKSDKEIKLKT